MDKNRWRKIPNMADPDMHYGIEPVSYTHLDVYKRQHRKHLLIPRIPNAAFAFSFFFAVL